jgi:hypothetical protein
VLPPPRASVGLTQDRTTPPQRQTVPLNMRAAIASSRDAASRVNLGTPRAWRALTLYYEACCRAWSGSNHGAQRTRRKLHADTKTFPCSPPISTCCKISFSTPCSPCPLIQSLQLLHPSGQPSVALSRTCPHARLWLNT